MTKFFINIHIHLNLKSLIERIQFKLGISLYLTSGSFFKTPKTPACFENVG